LTAVSPDLGAARARVGQAQAESAASRLIPNPTLDASLSGIPVSSRVNNPRFSGNAIWSVGLSQTVELGKRGPRSAAADLREQASRLDLRGTLGERMAAARTAMADALHLALRTATLEASLHDAERATELEKVRYEQKALSGMDYDRLLLELGTLEAEVTRSRSELEASLGSCAGLLGAPCSLEEAAEEDLDRAIPLALAAGTDSALLNRPDLAGLTLESEASRRDAELARRRAIPDVTLRVGYNRDNSADVGEALDSFSVGLSLPLPVMDHGQHESTRALARASELDSQRKALLIAARADLFGLLKRKLALEHTLGLLEQNSLPLAKSVLESTQQAFDHGGISLTDFLLARRSYVGLRLTLLDQRFELFSIRNDLYRVLGLDARARE
jgi:cobalt-zinc-cadmium efflux system outer membrane protein